MTKPVCFALLLAAGCAVYTYGDAHTFEAGASKVDITPPIGTPLNGYGDRMGRDSIGVLDPLWARAVYLNDGATALFLVSLDLVDLPRELRDRVLALAPSAVPREHIILCATHTHNGSGAMNKDFPLRGVSGRFMPEVLESTAKGIARAMTEAYEGRKRASIGCGAIKQQDLSGNRRYPGGPRDEQIGIVLVVDADGNNIATIANMAAHPTTVGDDHHYLFSADYPGFFYNEMESLSTPGCVAMFLNGAEGNQTIGSPAGKGNMSRGEAVGRTLARMVKESSNKILCGEGKLHVGYAEPVLPPSLGDHVQPKSTVLTTLEINDFLMTFFPGEPLVELALELRTRALARGYKTQCTVGLSNDYLMYFAPRARYADLNYEASLTFFGPYTENWFYREFSKLMTKGKPEPELPVPPAPALHRENGAARVTLEGSPYAIGQQRGMAFKDEIRNLYQARIVKPVSTCTWMPKSGYWKYWPTWLDPAPIAVPCLGMATRPLLEGLPDALYEEVQGVADGAEMPFDAVWLLQNAPHFDALEKKDVLFQTPLCTMFAVVGAPAGADGLLIGRNLDWPLDESPAIIEVRPDGGRRYVEVGFPWNVGVFTGMNDAGLVLCAERVESTGTPPMKGEPVEMALHEVLANADGPLKALDMLRTKTHLRGYHVLVAGPEKKGQLAAVLEYGERIVERGIRDGVLAGVDLTTHPRNDDTKKRYARLAELTGAAKSIGTDEIKRVLGDTAGDAPGLAKIWNEQTRHSVIFQPKTKRMLVAFPNAQQGPGEYAPVTVGGNGHE